MVFPRESAKISMAYKIIGLKEKIWEDVVSYMYEIINDLYSTYLCHLPKPRAIAGPSLSHWSALPFSFFSTISINILFSHSNLC